MKKMLLSGMVVFALFSCNTQSGWSNTEKEAFVKNCVPNAQQSANIDETKAKQYCDCMFGKVEQKYPKAEDAVKLTAIEVSEMAKDCAIK